MTSDPFLLVEDLHVAFPTSDSGSVEVLRGVNLEIRDGESVGVVGESGAGKSLTSLAILGLLPPGAMVTRGKVVLAGVDVCAADEGTLGRLRRETAGIVFQDAMASLNPVMTVGKQIGEVLRMLGTDSRSSRERVVELLREVGIPEPKRRAKQYPHQLSGGMRQRAMTAMALAGDPRLLIADEPTTALDVTIQRQVLRLLRDAQSQRGMAFLLVTHDLGVAAGLADQIAVMYAGRVVEYGQTDALFEHPKHPYTAALLAATPSLATKNGFSVPIGGAPPQMRTLGIGCSFAPRCPKADYRCRSEDPVPAKEGRQMVECWKA